MRLLDGAIGMVDAVVASYSITHLGRTLALLGRHDESEAMQLPLLAIRRENHKNQPQDTIRMRRLAQALHAAGMLYSGGRESGLSKREQAEELLNESRVLFARLRDADVNNLSGPVELAIANIELARVMEPGARPAFASPRPARRLVAHSQPLQ